RIHRGFFAGGEVKTASGYELRAASKHAPVARSSRLVARSVSLRFREPAQRSARILSKRTVRQNLQILFVVFSGFGFISQFFLADGETEAGNGVVVFVVKSFLV